MFLIVVHNRSIYIFGGYDGFNRVNDFYEYNADYNNWTEVLCSGKDVSVFIRYRTWKLPDTKAFTFSCGL